MDLARKGHLTKSETFDVASTLHAMVLEELFRETDWLAPQAVFHGGTALALVRNSNRFSEDLDFMISREAAEGLEKSMEKVRRRVALAMTAVTPGCDISLKGPKGQEVEAWQFTWTHPQRRGKVMVKAEFLVTSAELLRAYRSTHLVPTSKGTVGVNTPIPVPELVSAWADKIKAIATRSDFKHRDAYDLAWIAECLLKIDDVPAEERIAALEATASIYGKTLDDVEAGLESGLAAGHFDELEAFEEDMGRWFPDDGFERAKKTGQFAQKLERSKSEVERAVALLVEHRDRPQP